MDDSLLQQFLRKTLGKAKWGIGKQGAKSLPCRKPERDGSVIDLVFCLSPMFRSLWPFSLRKTYHIRIPQISCADVFSTQGSVCAAAVQRGATLQINSGHGGLADA